MKRVYVPDPAVNPRHCRRAIGLAALALVLMLPLPANAGTKPAPERVPPALLMVSASLNSCDASGAQVQCKFSLSFESIPGASTYAASVTSADGSVTDLGNVAAGGGAVSVPYVGNGTYSFRISAYGTSR